MPAPKTASGARRLLVVPVLTWMATTFAVVAAARTSTLPLPAPVRA